MAILEKAGVSGYTVIEDVTGKGDRGRVINDFATQTFTNSYVMSICTEQQKQKLVEVTEPILTKFGGVCIVSDVQWIAD